MERMIFVDFRRWVLQQPVGQLLGYPGASEDSPAGRYLDACHPELMGQVRLSRAATITGQLPLVWLGGLMDSLQHELNYMTNADLGAPDRQVSREEILLAWDNVLQLGVADG